MEYNKLIRDKIPEIIKENGENPIIHIASEEEYLKKLREKLQEEVKEFLEDENEAELADILKVMDTLVEAKGYNKEKVQEIKTKREKERGGFSKRIILDRVE
jgi:predicted house-cleaning noncanonical NTP pyrophosphatase (MazG superfamily)